jgi:alpha-N-acetylglucosaminidase
MEKAWDSITETIYRNSGIPTPVYLRRPTFGDRSAYPDPKKMRETVELFLECSDEFGKNDLYKRDLVDLMKHYLGDATFFSLQRVTNAWQDGDRRRLRKHAREYLRLLNDIDTLVGTRPEYRLSKWINDARRWGKDTGEADFYEKNARLQLTVWGSTILFDYARKEWSGLVSDFYIPRFEEYFSTLAETDPEKFSQDEWSKTIAQWELDWCDKTGIPRDKRSRDSVDIAKKLFKRYKDWPEEWGPYSPAMGIAVGKPVTISGGTVHNHEPERAVDGNSWHVDSSWHAAPVPQWICIDLEKQEKIDRVHVFNRWANEYYQYTVETSVDGESWTMVADMSKNETISTSTGDLHKFDPVKARYVRVTILHNSANPGIHLVEVRVFRSKR